MNKIISLLQLSNYNIESITSIASVIIVFMTMLITIIYVKATLKLVHIPYLSHVMVDDINANQQVVIKNNGPGIVLNLTAVICCNRLIRKIDHTSEHYNFIKYFKSEIISELNAGNTTITSEFERINLSKLIELRWTSLTGKKYTKYYKYVGGRLNTRNATKLEILIFGLEKAKLLILKPYYYIRKIQYSQNEILMKKIIDIIRSKGPLEIDYITDEINKKAKLRTDDDIERVVKKMIRKKLVKFENFKVLLRNEK